MKKQFIILLVIALLIASLAPAVFAEDETYVVDETITIIEDHTFDDYGWLSVYANVPMGYEGIVCVELEDAYGQLQLIQILPEDMHVGGAWLLEGAYSVYRVYDPKDMLIGSCTVETVFVEHDSYADLTLDYDINPDYDLGDWTEPTGNSGTIPAPTEEETEATTEETTAETTEAPTTEPAPSQTSESASEGEESEKKNIVAEVIVTVVVALVFIGIIDYCVIAYRRKRKDTVY